MREGSILASVRTLILVTLILVAACLISSTAADTAWAQSKGPICGSCGTEVPAAALYCPHCGRPIDNMESIYCWRCGKALPADALYCAFCGSRVCSDHVIPGHATPGLGRPTPPSARILEPRPPLSPPAAVRTAPADSASAAATAQAEPAAIRIPAPADTAARGTPPTPQPSATTSLPLTPARIRHAGPTSLADFMGGRMLIQPPRLITSPTGTILPSMTLHISGGWAFGLSERQSTGGWLLSFGLGGVGEAMVSSSRILHALDMQSHALAGFRVGLPIGLINHRLKERLAVALNIAATGENDYTGNGAIPAGEGRTVSSLGYDHRETTLGIAATLQEGRLRLHGALHGTDLRAKGIYYSGDLGYGSLGKERETYETIGLGFDYSIDERTRALFELRTLPRISFWEEKKDLRVETLTEYAAGLRFYPVPILGLDATVAIDEEAVGLADLEIGFGFHVTLAPRKVAPAPEGGQTR